MHIYSMCLSTMDDDNYNNDNSNNNTYFIRFYSEFRKNTYFSL